MIRTLTTERGRVISDYWESTGFFFNNPSVHLSERRLRVLEAFPSYARAKRETAGVMS